MTEQIEEIWRSTVDILRESHGAPAFDTWFSKTRAIQLSGSTLVVTAPNNFTKDWLAQKYSPAIDSAVSAVMGESFCVQLVVDAQRAAESRPGASNATITTENHLLDSTPAPNHLSEHAQTTRVGGDMPFGAIHSLDGSGSLSRDHRRSDSLSPGVAAPTRRASDYPNGSGGSLVEGIRLLPNDASNMRSLNPTYTFDTFVTGASNRFAHAAALAVAERPAHAYNPLFLYGGVGLGKTHLLQAIGHYVANYHPHLKVKYVTSETFTNDFIDAIGEKEKGQMSSFHKKYRKVDVLLLDDIQFIQNKDATQEEFFHTFNELHSENKQIVISSDRQPNDLGTLEDRLRTRFQWGLIIDLKPPDLETRVKILKKKAKGEGHDIPFEVMEYIAGRFDSNIRELEGALTRVHAYAALTSSELNLSLAQEALESILPDNDDRRITVTAIQAEICRYYSMLKDDLVGPKRSRNIVYPRQIAMYLCRELTEESLPSIGRYFGNRDHTTVMHAIDKIQGLISTDHSTYDEVTSLTEKIRRSC